ncbi:MAG: dTDP-4-amino-4,6-dideoxygalactose transaminase [Methylococcales bacterium]
MIPFNKPYITCKELSYISEVISNGMLVGDGAFTRKCHRWLEEKTLATKVLLTHSCTAALELATLLLEIKPGDEIIMPSYTFVSTANAFVLRGAVPVFVDIREDTLNLDECLLESAITPKTKAIVPVHYAGVSCEMDIIMEIARGKQLKVVEDAAQGLMSSYKGQALGSIGNLGVYSFHETKNVVSGEGGAILVNDQDLVVRAEIIREKGTDRSQFCRSEVDKYTWQAIGSSFAPAELIAAFLWAQLEDAQSITNQRMANWDYYHTALAPFEDQGVLRRPIIPKDCQHNAHMYYVLLASGINRQQLLTELKHNGIYSVFHYVPLHSSPAGQYYGRVHGHLAVTDKQSSCLVRLPMWLGLTKTQQDQVVDVLAKAIYKMYTKS